jgi:hypothetical protein
MQAGQNLGSVLEVQDRTVSRCCILLSVSAYICSIVKPFAGAEIMGDDSRSRSRSHSRTPSRMDLSVHSEVTKKHLLKLADKSVRSTAFIAGLLIILIV